MNRKKVGYVVLSLFLAVIALTSSSYAIFKITIAGTKNYKMAICKKYLI